MEPRKLLTLAVLLFLSTSCKGQKVTDGVPGTHVVCYHTNWSAYRQGIAKFTPLNIDPFLCTHLIYAFGKVNENNTLSPFDENKDITEGGYANFTAIKNTNPRLQTIIAIGGSNAGSAIFSNIASNEQNRKAFVRNTVDYLKQYNFDGLDLDWQYPTFKDGSRPRDKENYAELVKELSEEFTREAERSNRTRLCLTMTVPASLEYIDRGFDIPKLSRYLDWMNLVAYDYRTAFDPLVNHHAALYSVNITIADDDDMHYDVNATIRHYMRLGADPAKMVLGIPAYGRSFTLEDPTKTDIGSPSSGPGTKGPFTGEDGYIAYYEICARVKNENWTVQRPFPDSIGPYAYKDDQWVSYDDREIVAKKAAYAVEHNLGGIAVWAMDIDDFLGDCHGVTYPIIRTAKEALVNGTAMKLLSMTLGSITGSGSMSTTEIAVSTVGTTEIVPSSPSSDASPTISTDVDSIIQDEVFPGTQVVCYFEQWSIYRTGSGKFTTEDIDPFLCTHLVYAFGGLTDNNSLIPYDDWGDLTLKGYANFSAIKKTNPRLQTILALGGSNEGSQRFSNIASNEENRKEFVENTIEYLRQYDFDGLDLDWQYPAFKDGSRPRDKENYAELVKELREEFAKEALRSNRKRLWLTMTVPASLEFIDRGFDIPKLSRSLDWMNLVSYDYRTPFDPVVNHHSALYNVQTSEEDDEDTHYDVDATVRYYMRLGADPMKIVLGIPTYGRSFTLQDPTMTSLGSPSRGPGTKAPFTEEDGYVGYFELCSRLKDENWTIVRPYPDSMGPYAYKDDQWVSFDDREIIAKKAQYAVDHNLAGIAVWAIDLDDFRGDCNRVSFPLIRTAKDALINGTAKKLLDIALSGTGEDDISPPTRPTTKILPDITGRDTTITPAGTTIMSPRTTDIFWNPPELLTKSTSTTVASVTSTTTTSRPTTTTTRPTTTTSRSTTTTSRPTTTTSRPTTTTPREQTTERMRIISSIIPDSLIPGLPTISIDSVPNVPIRPISLGPIPGPRPSLRPMTDKEEELNSLIQGVGGITKLIEILKELKSRTGSEIVQPEIQPPTNCNCQNNRLQNEKKNDFNFYFYDSKIFINP